jgi:maleate cis-trans isomerase
MSLEYAPHGLIGVLTPQANTTVEPEFALLCPPGYAVLNARMCSPKGSIVERLLDYLAGLEGVVAQFANAPLGAIAFACTGASYFAGPEQEDAIVARMEDATGRPVITAARAVRDAFDALGAKRIGLVSPYPPDLTEAARRYWTARGYDVASVAGAELNEGAFHPIYAMTGATAEEALAAIGTDLDAVVMLGTGMPTLRPILARPRAGQAPVVSCMLALAWRSVAAVDGRAPEAADLLRWVDGAHWGPRYRALREALVET